MFCSSKSLQTSAGFQCRQIQGSVWHLFNESRSSYREKKQSPPTTHVLLQKHSNRVWQQLGDKILYVLTGRIEEACFTCVAPVRAGCFIEESNISIKKEKGKKKITKITHLIWNILQNPKNCIYEAAGRLAAHFDTDSCGLQWKEKLVREETEVKGSTE